MDVCWNIHPFYCSFNGRIYVIRMFLSIQKQTKKKEKKNRSHSFSFHLAPLWMHVGHVRSSLCKDSLDCPRCLCCRLQCSAYLSHAMYFQCFQTGLEIPVKNQLISVFSEFEKNEGLLQSYI